MSEPVNQSASYTAYREAQAINRVTHRLQNQFPELPADTITAIAHGQYRELDATRPRRRTHPRRTRRPKRTDNSEAGAP